MSFQLDFLILTYGQVQAFNDVNPLLATATDCLRFVTEFFEVISLSAPHIYHSALQLAPHSSMIHELYGQQIQSLTSRVVTGIPTSWDSCTASAGAASEVCHAVWSPCGQFVVVGLESVVEVRDSNTLEKLYIPKPPHGIIYLPHSLAFSPDGCLLACHCQG